MLTPPLKGKSDADVPCAKKSRKAGLPRLTKPAVPPTYLADVDPDSPPPMPSIQGTVGKGGRCRGSGKAGTGSLGKAAEDDDEEHPHDEHDDSSASDEDKDGDDKDSEKEAAD